MEQNKNKHTKYLECVDYTVSREKYTLYYNEKYDILETKPIPKELNKYYESEEYISHTDSKKSITDKIYQFVKKINISKKIKIIEANQKRGTILDIGTGTGEFIKACKERKWQTLGIEPNNNARNLAKKKGIEVYQDLKNINDRDIDIITMWHVLEHVPDINNCIKEMKEKIKDDGTIVIAVPNYKSYDAQYYKEYWAAYDVPRHLWHFSKKGIEKIFEEHDLKLKKIIPMKFDSYYVSLLSEKNRGKRFTKIRAIYRGLKSNIKARKNKEYSSLIYIFEKKVQNIE